MRIPRIEKIKPTGENVNNDSWQTLEIMRRLDQQKTERERYLKEAGISKNEYLEQTTRARKIGFAAMFEAAKNKKIGETS